VHGFSSGQQGQMKQYDGRACDLSMAAFHKHLSQVVAVDWTPLKPTGASARATLGSQHSYIRRSC